MIDKSEILHNVKTGSDTDIYLARINTDNKSADFTKIKLKNGVDKFPYLTRTTGNSLKPTTEFIQSNELRKGGAESAPRPGNTSVDGSLDVELSPVTFDDNISAAFDNEWKRWASDTDSDINFDKQHCAEGFFLTRANSTDETEYNDDENLKPRRLLDDGVPGHEDGLLKVPAGCVVSEMTFGKKKIEYSVIKKYGGVEDEDMYHVFKRLAIGTLDLNAQIGSIVTGSFGFMGDASSDIMTEDETRAYFGGEDTDKFENGETTGNAFVENLPEQATETDQYTSREGDLWINGKNITFGQTLTFNIDKNMDKKYALFVKNPIAKTSQKKAITANLETYLVPESRVLYNLANKNKTFEVLFAFEDKGYMNDSFKEEDKPEFIYLFQIFSAKAEDKDLSASGEADYSMSIPLRSFGERLCRVFRIALPKARDAEFVPAQTDGAAWTDAGTVVVRPTVPVVADDISGKITVVDTLKKEDGTVIATQTPTATASNITVDDDGLISVAEETFVPVTGQVLTNAAYREVEITFNGETVVRTFALTENEGPDPVSDVEITVKSKKATFTWTDPSTTDFDHVLIDVQDTAGKSVISGSEEKGVQAYTATGLSTGATYTVDFIAVDKNGNKSTKVTKTFETSAIVLGSVTGLTATVDSEDAQKINVTWSSESANATGVHVELYKGDTLVDSDDVAAGTKAYSKDSLDSETEYRVVATPYKTLEDARLLGTEEEATVTTGA